MGASKAIECWNKAQKKANPVKEINLTGRSIVVACKQISSENIIKVIRIKISKDFPTKSKLSIKISRNRNKKASYSKIKFDKKVIVSSTKAKKSKRETMPFQLKTAVFSKSFARIRKTRRNTMNLRSARDSSSKKKIHLRFSQLI